MYTLMFFGRTLLSGTHPVLNLAFFGLAIATLLGVCYSVSTSLQAEFGLHPVLGLLALVATFEFSTTDGPKGGLLPWKWARIVLWAFLVAIALWSTYKRGEVLDFLLMVAVALNELSGPVARGFRAARKWVSERSTRS